ncbi:hypothetical protein GCM10028807_51730 [Spirosoma daeguense]
MATYLLAQDVLNVTVSCFANYNTPSNPKPVKVISWLTSTKYSNTVEQIRAEPDKAKRDALKATLPAITPSGDFDYRSASKLKPDGHSRLLQFDIDLKDNPHIRNYTDLKTQLAKLPFVAYCGLSVSGTGYWGLIPIAHPDRHGQHFDAMKRVFVHYKIVLDDKPRNVASLRGYSYDPTGYFADSVMLFELYDEPQQKPARSFDYSQFDTVDDSGLLTRIARLVQEAGEGNRHAMLLKAARLAGGYIAANRMDEQTVVCALETIASEWPMFSKSQKTIRDGIRYGQVSPIYPQERTTPLEIKSKTCSRPTYKTYESKVVLSKRIDTTVREVVIVSNVEKLLTVPTGVTIRPDPAQLEVLDALPHHTEDYPPEWDEPNPPGAVPTIRQQSFFEWQRSAESPFSKLGLASLQKQTQS